MTSYTIFEISMFYQAANPGCLLEDFVRWYSPNDWLRGEETEDEIEYRKKLENEQKGIEIFMPGQL